jgi:DNA-binding PadR family transcriptional regulator
MASKRLGRTQDPTILVLTSLTGGPKHGYAIIKDIEAMTGTVFGPGTLYGVLVRLEEEGLVEALAADDRRRPYRITGHGAAVLTERLQTSMKVATIGLARASTSHCAAIRSGGATATAKRCAPRWTISRAKVARRT